MEPKMPTVEECINIMRDSRVYLDTYFSNGSMTPTEADFEQLNKLIGRMNIAIISYKLLTQSNPATP